MRRVIFGSLIAGMLNGYGFAKDRPLIIAHRGASGYLPEHTLAAYATAATLKADFLEPDLVLTKDGELICLHDIHLDTTTDVASVFPGRRRPDGRYYAIDFTLAEIKQLKVGERRDLETGEAVFPKRFPGQIRLFFVPTFAEMFALVHGLNRSMNLSLGIIPELKDPSFHLRSNQDITQVFHRQLLGLEHQFGSLPTWVQCFETAPLVWLKNSGVAWRLLRLFEADLTPEQVREQLQPLIGVADGVGVAINQLLRPRSNQPTGLAKHIREFGFAVMPYTFRVDQFEERSSADQILENLFGRLRVDGLFSDQPDVLYRFLQNSQG